ncbi:hypothetical protein V494_06577 [Pseudogymnoascus sp. VKM F-4513 (FW-928)]|nr:hypothetical protein V494_06577 [Pseudogymnoascus sp. VKM F-4513 (FW-928)]
MQTKFLSALAILTVVTPALSMPAVLGSNIDVRSAPAGDGYYYVSKNDDGTHSTAFKSLADLNFTVADAGYITPSADSFVQKRNGDVACGNMRLNADDTLKAQSCLRAAADREKAWFNGHWAFCKVGGTMAFACSYQDTNVNSGLLNDFQLSIDHDCGWPQGGNKRCKNDCGVSDFDVGRTFSGDHFCTKDFVGW